MALNGTMSAFLREAHKKHKAAGRQAKVVFINQGGYLETIFEDAEIVKHFWPAAHSKPVGPSSDDMIPVSRVRADEVQKVITKLTESGYSCAVVETGVRFGLDKDNYCNTVCMFYFPSVGRLVSMPVKTVHTSDEEEDWMTVGSAPLIDDIPGGSGDDDLDDLL